MTIAYAALGADLFGEGPAIAVAFRVAGTDPDVSGLPDALRPLLASCLVKDPTARPAPADLIAAVERAGAPVASGPWLPYAVVTDIVAARQDMTRLPQPGTASGPGPGPGASRTPGGRPARRPRSQSGPRA
ncbi:hypothetical protein [Streptomyces sp. NPDC048411]|uniref:hypothetical protein n=1 Tax=Streptomyces sp. NPDC048411 TaxID=3157206 RepID=UPI003456DBC5